MADLSLTSVNSKIDSISSQIKSQSSVNFIVDGKALNLSTTLNNITFDSGTNISLSVDTNSNVITINNTYNPPINIAASAIITDTNHRFVTDAQINAWNLVSNSYMSSVPGGDALITSINQASSTSTINGQFLHITSSTTFDSGIIVGTVISPGSVPLSSLVNSVQTNINNGQAAYNTTSSWASFHNVTLIDGGKIYTGSITADKIQTGSITIGMMDTTAQSTINDASSNATTALNTANSVNTTVSGWQSNKDVTYIDGGKIYTGSITTDKIHTGSITIGLLDLSTQNTITTSSSNAANAVTTANSANATAIGVSDTVNSWKSNGDVTLIDGGKIYTGSITVDKIDTSILNLTTNGRTLNAGAVQLNNNGMSIIQSDGSSTNFNSKGLTWVDTNGNANGFIRRLAVVTVSTGTYVTLNWTNPPFVLLSPNSMLSTNSSNFTKIHLAAENISSAGFRARGWVTTTSATQSSFSLSYNGLSSYDTGYTDNDNGQVVWGYSSYDSEYWGDPQYLATPQTYVGTTPNGTGSLTFNWVSTGHSNSSPVYLGAWYKMAGASTWILAGKWGWSSGTNANNEYGTVIISPQQLGTPGQFDIALGVLNGNGVANGSLTCTYTYGDGSPIEMSDTMISYIAMEVGN